MITAANYTSEAEIIAGAKAARRACYGRPKLINIRCQPKPTVEEQAPAEPSTPMAFIRSQCALHGINYPTLVAHINLAEIAKARKAIIIATREEYPTISFQRLGHYFNRNHSTIVYALGMMPKKKAAMLLHAERDRQAKALYREGLTMEAIAERLSISLSAVKKIKTRNNWDARVKPRAVRVELAHEKEARRLYDAGMSLQSISRCIGMHKDAARMIKKRWNWPDREKDE